jgi:hypothetical protein
MDKWEDGRTLSDSDSDTLRGIGAEIPDSKDSARSSGEGWSGDKACRIERDRIGVERCATNEGKDSIVRGVLDCELRTDGSNRGNRGFFLDCDARD